LGKSAWFDEKQGDAAESSLVRFLLLRSHLAPIHHALMLCAYKFLPEEFSSQKVLQQDFLVPARPHKLSVPSHDQTGCTAKYFRAGNVIPT
jgi:hypothetical protein